MMKMSLAYRCSYAWYRKEKKRKGEERKEEKREKVWRVWQRDAGTFSSPKRDFPLRQKRLDRCARPSGSREEAQRGNCQLTVINAMSQVARSTTSTSPSLFFSVLKANFEGSFSDSTTHRVS